MTEHDHTLWDNLVHAVCILCGRLTERICKPNEVPVCERCSKQDSEAAD